MKKKFVEVLILTAVLIMGFAVLGTVAFAEENSESFSVNSVQSTVTKGTVDATILTIRENPGTNYAVVGKLTRGAEVSILDQSGSWYKIESDGIQGWIHGAYVDDLYEGVGTIGTIDNVSRGDYSARTGSGGITAVNASKSSALGESITTYSQNYLGKPYKYGAAGPNAFDCSGFVYTVFGAYGITVPRSSSAYLGVGTAVSLDDARAGDVICFSRNGKNVSHVGIYMGNGSFIHSATSSGVIISSTSDKYWGPKIYSIRRIV
ncbi:MAG: C40 family peptidase [Firmicutes bacterium]|nr:C40 family peptidase [Bacillota bacterium]